MTARHLLPFLSIAATVLAIVPGTAPAADAPANPNQPTIDQINDRKALIDAQDALLKSQIALIKDSYPAFGDHFGKTGALTVDEAERDKFHVTLRSAEAFEKVAEDLVRRTREAVARADGTLPPVLLLSDADRQALQLYGAEKMALDNLEARTAELLKEPQAGAAPESLGPAVFEIGTLLSQLAQFTQLFRTDKNVSFTDSVLPDEVLLDMIAARFPPETVKYPAGEIDGLLSPNAQSAYAARLSALLAKRVRLAAIAEARTVVDAIDALSTRLATQDAATKMLGLTTVMRGELVQRHASLPGVRTLSVKVVSKGGASLKTSSVWRSDRLYASGGLIASYRISGTGNPSGMKAGVVSSESGFVQVPLETRRN